MSDIGLNNYIRIYCWRFLSILTGFLSLLVVIPHLSSSKDIYGVYAFCMSFTLYLSYADLGFLGAGQKFAGESFSKKDTAEEVGATGFSIFLLILFFIPFSAFMTFLSIEPQVVLNDLNIESEKIASELFLIMALLLPLQILLQRIVDFILIIRLMDFIALKINIAFNFIKIISVFFFFSESNYLLTEYFLFITALSIASSVISIIIIKVELKYDFVKLIKCIKFSSYYYHKLKKLALSSFFLTLSFIIYYEMDLIIIGKWFGAEYVAIYSIGFTFINFLRNIWNIFYSPLSQRLNHYVGLKDYDSFTKMFESIIEYTLPLYLILTVTLMMSANNIVLYWVGEEYLESIPILKILILSTFLGVLSKPASFYFVSHLKYKYIYIQAIVSPVVFYVTLYIASDFLGVISLAYSKLFVSISIAVIVIPSILKIVSWKVIFQWWILFSFFVITYLTWPHINVLFFIQPEKNTFNLVLYMIFISIYMLMFYVFFVFINRNTRNKSIKYVTHLYKKIIDSLTSRFA